MIKNAEITKKARVALKNNWINPILLVVLFYLTIGLPLWIHPYFGMVLSLFIGPILIIGLFKFFLESTSRKDVEIEILFSGYKRFFTSFIAYLVIGIGVGVGYVLLIVPGIIFGIATALTFFIIAEDPNISAMDAIKLSIKMMKGKKWKYFLFCCRFIGWALLGILTLGIGFLWVYPYAYMSTTIFYQEAKAEHLGLGRTADASDGSGATDGTGAADKTENTEASAFAEEPDAGPAL